MADKISIWEPTYEGVSADIAAECRAAWDSGRPWTPIRELQKGTDNSDGASCAGTQGKFHLECKNKVEGVQYTSAHGTPQFYCEEHALAQNDWDKIFYDSKPREIKESQEVVEARAARIAKLLEKKKKKQKPEPEEIDPTA